MDPVADTPLVIPRIYLAVVLAFAFHWRIADPAMLVYLKSCEGSFRIHIVARIAAKTKCLSAFLIPGSESHRVLSSSLPFHLPATPHPAPTSSEEGYGERGESPHTAAEATAAAQAIGSLPRGISGGIGGREKAGAAIGS
jgi:hypothetical protein